jgi:hypothetical protein
MERILVQRQDSLAESRGRVALNLIAVYKALGGGWATRFAGGPATALPGVIPSSEEGAEGNEARPPAAGGPPAPPGPPNVAPLPPVP